MMIKEIHWKLIAQCLAGTLSGMGGGAIGFFSGITIGSNYEIGGVYGAITGIIIGSIIGTLFFKRLKIENYKNISLTGTSIALIIILTHIATRFMNPPDEGSLFILSITTFAFSLFIGMALIPSVILTLYIHFYKKKHL